MTPMVQPPILVAQGDGQQSAANQTRGPAGMEYVEPFNLLGFEHGGHDGVDDGFDGAVAKAEDDAASVENPVGGFAAIFNLRPAWHRAQPGPSGRRRP